MISGASQADVGVLVSSLSILVKFCCKFYSIFDSVGFSMEAKIILSFCSKLFFGCIFQFFFRFSQAGDCS
jgi:hypothetical protein